MDLHDMSAITVNEKPVRLIQITDTHLGPLTSESLLGLNTDESLEDVLQLITAEQPTFDYLVCTGDIASAGDEACYRRFIDTIRRYFPVPFAWIPGNHDSAVMMSQLAIPNPPEGRLVDLGAWVIILLDSAVPEQVYGNLEQTELDFLEQALADHADRHVMVMLHHQPLPVGSAWIDQYVLRNADAFLAIVDRSPQVRTVVWGHVHQEFSCRRKHMQLFATPSTCVQFKPNSDAFAVDTAMPGYRWFELYPDGSIETGVSRVSGKSYVIDYKSAGY
jgi:Icc protein